MRVGPVAGGADAGGEDRAEAVVGAEREGAEREPERAGGGAGPRAFERDLAEVQFVRGEVGVRRVVTVEPADGRIAEEDAAAAVGLEPVLVRIDRNRIARGERAERFGRKVVGRGTVGLCEEREEAAVRRVGVDADAVAVAAARARRGRDRRRRGPSSPA